MTGQEIKKMLNLPELSIDFIPYGTDEWYEYRKTGIGGSEIATIMGANKKYDCAARLYNVKIGRIVDKQQDNEAMYHGRHLEDYIANMWKYYNGRDNYIDNANEGKEQRQCIKVEGFIRNRMYPFLFASVDRLILPGVLNYLIILFCVNRVFWRLRQLRLIHPVNGSMKYLRITFFRFIYT
jgi:hypothetical protein